MKKCDMCNHEAKEQIDKKGNSIYTCKNKECGYVVQHP